MLGEGRVCGVSTGSGKLVGAYLGRCPIGWYGLSRWDKWIAGWEVLDWRVLSVRMGALLWGDEGEHPCEDLVDAGGFCGGGGVDGEVGAVGFFEA